MCYTTCLARDLESQRTTNNEGSKSSPFETEGRTLWLKEMLYDMKESG